MWYVDHDWFPAPLFSVYQMTVSAGEEDAFKAFRSSAEDTLGAVGGAVGSMASGLSVAYVE